MEEKKSPKANLEFWKTTFFLIGLILSLVIAWRVFEVRTYDKIEKSDLNKFDEIIDEEFAEITKQEEQKPPEIEVQKQATQIQVVENDVEVKDDNLFDAEVTQDEAIEDYEPPVVEEDEVVEQEIFTIVEEMPEFPGGMAKLSEYLAKNIKYPQMAREAGVQGKVFITFVIEPDGSVSHVQVLRSLGGGCDEEAVRVVKAMPKWKAGKQRGKPVRVSYNLPVNFKLQ